MFTEAYREAQRNLNRIARGLLDLMSTAKPARLMTDEARANIQADSANWHPNRCYDEFGRHIAPRKNWYPIEGESDD